MTANGYRVILIIGLVSLLGDFVYEGGRSVLPDYMRQLGMSAFLIGASLGFAEFAGWAARPLGGLIADKTGRYSLVVKLGYGALIVIPLMWLASAWWLLVALAFVERVSRGLRIPSRDAMLAKLRGRVGLGTAFGIHELLDQVGATVGPLMAIVVLTVFNSTHYVFIFLTIPYAALLATLTFLPQYRENPRELKQMRPSRGVLTCSAAAGLNVAGLLPLSLVLYMVSVSTGTGSWLVPAAYTLAMVADAVAGLFLGRAFDRWGTIVVGFAVVLSVFPALLIDAPLAMLMVCSMLVGVVIGAQESIFRALVAQLAGREGLGWSYAIYGLAIGIGGAVAGPVYGYMLESNTPTYVIFLYAVVVQALALILLTKALKDGQRLFSSEK